MDQSLDSTILILLEQSSVPDLTKDLTRNALPSMDEAQKLEVLKTLTSEQKKLTLLGQKEERIVNKYSLILENISKKQQ